MDTSSTSSGVDPAISASDMAAFVAQQINVIKRHMPETYKAIQARSAAEDLGGQAFTLVRRGIRGEVNCFYAVEGGHIVGTPFNMPEVTGPIAMSILTFGCGFLIMWPEAEHRKARVLAEQGV